MIFSFAITAQGQDLTQLGHVADSVKQLELDTADDKLTKEYKAMRRYVKNKLLSSNKKVMLMVCNGSSDVPSADIITLRRIHRKFLPFETGCCNYSLWRVVADGEFIWTDLKTCQGDLKKAYYTNTSHLEMEEDGKNIFIVLKRNGIQMAKYRVDTRYTEQYDEKGKIKQQLTTLFKVEGEKAAITSAR